MITTGMFSSFFRAVQIAKIGGYSVGVGYDATTYPNAHTDFKMLLDALGDWFDNFTAYDDADIKIELVKPDINAGGQAIDYIKSEFADISNNPAPYRSLNERVNSFLKFQFNTGKVSAKQVETAIAISKTIAQIDNCKIVDVEHVAEALLYTLDDNTDIMVDAVKPYTYIGENIRIENLPIDSVSAIKHLETAKAEIDGVIEKLQTT